jgi:hypothetical protein
MNYIDWELTRQKAVLFRLLSGGREDAESERTERAVFSADGMVPERDRPAGAPTDGTDGVAPAEYRTGQDAGGSLSVSTTAEPAAKTPPGADGGAAPVPGRPSAATGAANGRSFRAAAAAAGEAYGAERRETAVLPGFAAMEAELARTVSMQVERDARRYDGGYALY